MTKELTPLEALHDLMNNPYYIALGRVQGKAQFNKDIQIIEAALKREDSIEITAIEIEQDNKELCKENKKLKRVLEIIKKQKCIHILALKSSVDQGAYNQFILPLNRYLGIKLFDKLTQEEYDLLKEVLL